MKPILFGAIICIYAGSVDGQGISTKLIERSKPTTVRISQSVATVIQFPEEVNGVFGLGLSDREKAADTKIQAQVTTGNRELVVHALSPDVHSSVTVKMGEQLFVLEMVSDVRPDVALTLIDGKAKTQAVEVTPQSVVDSRPPSGDEALVNLLDRASAAPVLAQSIPENYQGFQTRLCDYRSLDKATGISTLISKVSKFTPEDAIVMEGEVENTTDNTFYFEPRNAQVAIGGFTRPASLIRCAHEVAAHSKSPLYAVVVGDIDGGKANIAINNDFRVMVTQPTRTAKEPTIPDHQTGPIIKETPPSPLLPKLPNIKTTNQ